MTRTWVPDLITLRLLVAVESLGSLGQAAQSEDVTQPAASKRIARLEREMGVPLLTRTPAGSQLTLEGKVVADWARRVIDTVDQMLGAAASLRTSTQSDLRIAASMTVAEHLVPAWLSDLRSAHPDLHVGLRVANSRDVQQLVLDGDAEIGFVETPALDKRLACKQVAQDRLAVVVAPDHPWAGRRRPLRREDLVNTALVVRELGSGTRETLDRVLGRDSSDPHLELGSNAAVKGTVIAGAGPAVLSLLAVASDIEAGRLVELRVEDVELERDLCAVWPRTRHLTAPSLALIQTAIRLHGSSHAS